jgi:hypothetical protein
VSRGRITNAIGETVERTWNDDDLDALICRCHLDRIEVPADVAAELARLVRRGAASTRRGRPVHPDGPDVHHDRPTPTERS